MLPTSWKRYGEGVHTGVMVRCPHIFGHTVYGRGEQITRFMRFVYFVYFVKLIEELFHICFGDVHTDTNLKKTFYTLICKNICFLYCINIFKYCDFFSQNIRYFDYDFFLKFYNFILKIFHFYDSKLCIFRQRP